MGTVYISAAVSVQTGWPNKVHLCVQSQGLSQRHGLGEGGESRSLLPAVTSQTVSAPQPVQRKMFNPACYLNTQARAVLTFQAMLGEWQEGKWCLTTFKHHRRNEGGGGLMFKL